MTQEASMPNFTVPDAVFEEAVRRFPTPFYLYDEAGIRRTVKKVQAAFSWNPDYRQYYAVKALPNPQILKIMLDLGCGLDCSSMTELLLAERLGVRGRDVMFTANAMPGAEMAYARGMEAIINLDDINDVTRLIHHGGVPELAGLRVNPGSHGAQRAGVMGSSLDAKFGMMPSQLLPALNQLKAEGARRFGLHTMTDSNTLDPNYYINNARYLSQLGAELADASGMELAYINLAGGMGIPYRPEETQVDLDFVAAGVQEAFTRHLGGRQVALFTELGRYITGPHGFLVAMAIHEKKIWRDYIGLDASAADLLRPAKYGAYHHITVLGKREAPQDQVYDVTGPLCENNDKFAIQRPLPRIEKKDILFIHDAGAHGHAMGFQYNGRLRCAEVLYTEEGDYRLIRRAETAEDYFRTMVFDG